MAFTKYASFEVSKILDVKGSAERDASASLSRVANFEDYRTQDGYLYARIRAISSRVNKNHDGWPSIELAGNQEIFDRHLSSAGGFTVEASKDAQYGFSTFLGKPIFVDHHNSDPSRARGVIVDAKLHVEDHKTAAQKDSYYRNAPSNHTPPTWVELLLEVDAKSFPKLAKAIIDGSRNAKNGIDGFSMGCDVERSVCNICKNAASTPDEFCNHVKMKGAYFDYIDDNGHKTSKKAYEDCYGIKFFEISAVFDPADETALIREVRSSTSNTCSDCGTSGDCPRCKHEKGVKERPYSKEELDRNLDKTENEEVKEKQRAWIKKHKKEASMNKTAYEVKCPTCQWVGEPTVTNSEISPKTICAMCNNEIPQSSLDQYSLIDQSRNFQASMNKFAPLGEYDKYFGGAGAAKKAHESMIDQYGEEKGEEVFYATMNKKKNQHEAADKPQSTKTRAPEEVDTLREDSICEICGSTMEGPQCDVCGYEAEPDGFGDPDLTAAKEFDRESEENEETEDSLSNLDVDTNNFPTVAHVTTAQINQVEKPRLPAPMPPASNEPKDHVVEDQKEPVTSSVRTASDFLAVANKTQRNNMETHIADAQTSAPAVAKPDHNTEVLGTGGVGEATNESASKADAQVNVADIGGVSGVGTGNEETSEVAQGDEHSKNIEAIHTDTFGPSEGDSLGQQDPVSRQPFPASDEGVKSSHWVVSDVKGVRPSDSIGEPDERISVTDDLGPHAKTTDNSGPTKTWTGTEGNGVTRQQDPVTGESSDDHQNSKEFSPSGVEAEDHAFGDKNAHLMTAFKLADTEIELGILDASQKYARVAELEKAAPSIVEASLAYATRVKTAGLKKSARVAKRLPSLVKGASSTAPESTQTDADDSALFM